MGYYLHIGEQADAYETRIDRNARNLGNRNSGGRSRLPSLDRVMSDATVWIEIDDEEREFEVDYYYEPEEKPSRYSPGDPGGLVIRSCREVLSQWNPRAYGEDIWDSLPEDEKERIIRSIERSEREWV